MNLDKVEENIAAAVSTIEEIEAGDAGPSEATDLSWRALRHLSTAVEEGGRARTKAPGQLLVRRLIVEECERLVARCRRAVGVTP